MKEFYSNPPHIYHLDSTFSILLYWIYHISIHLANPRSIHQSILFFDAFQRSCRHQYTSPQVLQNANINWNCEKLLIAKELKITCLGLPWWRSG